MRYGLIGEKLGHSYSKGIHEQLADYTYELIPLTPEECDVFLTEKPFTAINVTIPYKERVIPFLDELEAAAKSIGAVNTIVQKNGKWTGFNTDYHGFRYVLEHNGFVVKDKKVLLLGKGGAAKACLAVVGDMGAKEIHTVYYKESPDTITYAECYANHQDADLIINTTPVGMYPKGGVSPIELDGFTNLSGVVDIVYNPLRTKMVVDATIRGIKAIGGLEMLIGQAAVAVEIFTGKPVSWEKVEEIYKTMYAQRENVVLIGMSGCGKSTLGKAIAEKTGKTFVDMDTEIVAKIGMPIADYFAKEGEVAFRLVETEVAKELSGKTDLVIATGGGVIKNAENIHLLMENGKIIWLKREVELLESGNGRPLAPTQTATLALYQERLPLYEGFSEMILENNGSVAEALETLGL
ncbi:shikimate kinase [Chakrabartyella piscis]|uniref:shikimate kinase n=1 Tax=Chakrabartyella piscis TaxID=2918914 RepID=UPI0029585006|nr:shikimate kinase [Chakrabartyella piscis]